jgi:hypothetical protein
MSGCAVRGARGGLSDRITFALEDYRATQGTFDRIYAKSPFGRYTHRVAIANSRLVACEPLRDRLPTKAQRRWM